MFNNAYGLAPPTMEGSGAITGSRNTAVGSKSLFANVSGGNNTALGYQTLKDNVSGSSNTAIGSLALLNNTGAENTAVGVFALGTNTTGASNTAVGVEALVNNQGNDNVAVGALALQANNQGQYNTAVGKAALNQNNSGNKNTAVGYSSLSYVTGTTNLGNTAVGHDAGNFRTMSNSTYVGYAAYPLASGYDNAMGLGYNARPTGNNVVHIGNTSIQSIKGQVGFTTYSDARYKKNVTADVKGLDFIMKLRPVTYNVAANELATFLKEDTRSDENGNITTTSSASDREGRNAQEHIRYTGFLAQEVEAAARSVGFDFSGVDKPKNAEDLYGLRYAEFVVPLVKAVQEQQAMIEELQRQIKVLEAR